MDLAPLTPQELRAQLERIGADMNLLDSTENYIKTHSISKINPIFIKKFSPFLLQQVNTYLEWFEKEELERLYPNIMEAWEMLQK